MKTYLDKRSNSAGRFRNGGFTFVEMLISFSLFLLLTFFLSTGMHMLLKERITFEDLQKMEWEVFVSQAAKEIRMCDGVFITGDSLSFTMDGKRVTYEMWGSNLRRQVDGKGHELILHEVKTAAFAPVSQGVKIAVTDRFKQTYSVVIRTPIRGDSDDL